MNNDRDKETSKDFSTTELRRFFTCHRSKFLYKSRCSRITFRTHEKISQVAFSKAPKWRRNIYIYTHIHTTTSKKAMAYLKLNSFVCLHWQPLLWLLQHTASQINVAGLFIFAMGKWPCAVLHDDKV